MRAIVPHCTNYVQVLRHLGLRPAGGNASLLKAWLKRWDVSTDHFDPRFGRKPPVRQPVALEVVMVECSTYSRTSLKKRLFDEGLKNRVCELCGQGEIWRGKRMSLILDHVNGVATDHRLENLRIVCPNCAATLETHCGRHRRVLADRACRHCLQMFRPTYRDQQYCSLACARQSPASRQAGVERRRVERPPYDQLMEEVKRFGWSGTGRRYGVSDNAIRKWVKWYERELEDLSEEDRRAA